MMSVVSYFFIVAALSSSVQATSNEVIQNFSNAVTTSVSNTLKDTFGCFEEVNTKVLKNSENFLEEILQAQREFSENITQFDGVFHKQRELENIGRVSWSSAGECYVDFLNKFKKSYEGAADSAMQCFDVVKELTRQYEGCTDEECGSRLMQKVQRSGEDVKKDLDVVEGDLCAAVKKLEVNNNESCLKTLKKTYVDQMKHIVESKHLVNSERPTEDTFNGKLAKFRDNIKIHLEIGLQTLSETFYSTASINIQDCPIAIASLKDAKAKALTKVTGQGRSIVSKVHNINNLELLGRIEVAKAYVVSSKNLTVLYGKAAKEANDVLKVLDEIAKKYENCKGDEECVSKLQMKLVDEDEGVVKKLTSIVTRHRAIIEDVIRSFAVELLEPIIAKYIKMINQVISAPEQC